MRILVLLVVIAAAAGVFVFWRRRRKEEADDPCLRRRDVDVRVSSKQTPPTQTPNQLRDLCRKANVHYLVTNDSDDPVVVSLENFKKKNTGESRQPLEFQSGHSVEVPARHRRTIVAKVRVDPDAGEDTTTFKYDIRIQGGAVNDPELQIRRPARSSPDL